MIKILFRLGVWAVLALVFLGVVRLARCGDACRVESTSSTTRVAVLSVEGRRTDAVVPRPEPIVLPVVPSAPPASTPDTKSDTPSDAKPAKNPDTQQAAQLTAQSTTQSTTQSATTKTDPKPATPSTTTKTDTKPVTPPDTTTGSTSGAANSPTTTPPPPIPVVGAIPKSGANNGRRHVPSRETQDPFDDGSNGGLGTLPPGPGPEYEGLGVQCISRTTRRKLAGVSVRWALAEDLDAWRAANPGRNVEDVDPDVILSANKKPSLSAEGGVALTPSAPGLILVDARIGNQYGFAWVDRGKSARVTIELVEDRDLFFRVLAPDGTPRAGVPVVVRDSSCAEIWRGVTQGSDGIARMRHAGFLIERDASPGRCVALIDGVAPSARVLEIPRGALPTGDLDLASVPTGRVVVRVNDETGARVREPVVVGLATEGADVCGRATTRVAVDGECAFDHVEPGTPLRVTVDGLDVWERVSALSTGPGAANETRTIDLAFRRRLPSVRVHLVEAPAIPIENAHGAAWLELVDAGGHASTWPAKKPLVTDGEGRTQLVFEPPPEGTRVQAVFVTLKNRYSDWYSSARIPLAEGTLRTDTDLGKREVTEMPTLAAGYVLDDRGSPVPDAVIEVSGGGASGSPEEFAADVRWSAVADGMGRFRLRGFVEGERIALCASAPGHLRPERLVVPRGEKKVSLKLSRTSSITGKLLLPARMPLDDVRLWVECDGETIPGLLDPSGTYRVGDIRPGTASLYVLVAGLDTPVYSVPGLTAKAGTEINDANVATIDLRTRLSYVSLYVLDPKDSPVTNGVARVIEATEEGPRARSVPILSGFASYYTTFASVDVEIEADGFAKKKLEDVDRDTEVHLEPIAR